CVVRRRAPRDPQQRTSAFAWRWRSLEREALASVLSRISLDQCKVHEIRIEDPRIHTHVEQRVIDSECLCVLLDREIEVSALFFQQPELKQSGCVAGLVVNR